MLIFETRIFVRGKTSRQITRFLYQLDRSTYRQWHPEHVDFRWLTKEKQLLNSRLYISENIEGRLVQNCWQVIEVKNNTLITFKAERVLPIFFELELCEQKEGTQVLQRIKLGYNHFFGKMVNPLIGFVFKYLLKKKYFRHILEEYKKLEELC